MRQFRVAVSGFRKIPSELPLTHWFRIFDDHIGPEVEKITDFYVGGALGIDLKFLMWATLYFKWEDSVNTHLVVPYKIGNQPISTQEFYERNNTYINLIELESQQFFAPNAYHSRNRWMCNNSNKLFAFPSAVNKNGGTWETIKYALNRPMLMSVIPLSRGGEVVT